MAGRVTVVVAVVCLIAAASTVAQAPAPAESLSECFVSCISYCPSKLKGRFILACPLFCLGYCANPLPAGASFTENTCKIGCIASNCTSITALINPIGEELQTCMESCSGACTNGQ